MWIMIVLGVIAFLVMEHEILFWVVFVPLCLFFITSIVGLFRNQRAGLSNLLWAFSIFIAVVGLLVFVAA